MKNKPLVTGIIAVASPLPLIVFTVLWSWIWFFGNRYGVIQLRYYSAVDTYLFTFTFVYQSNFWLAWNCAWYNKDKAKTSMDRNPVVCVGID